MNPRRLRVLGGRSTVSEAELVAAISSATGLDESDAKKLENLLRSTPTEVGSTASGSEITEKLAAVLRGHGFDVSVESMASAHHQLILWAVLAAAFTAAFWLPPKFIALIAPLSPIVALYLLLKLHRVLHAFDHTSSLNRIAGVVELRLFLDCLVNAPMWMRRTIGVCCFVATAALFVVYW